MKSFIEYITEIQNLHEAGGQDYWYNTKTKKFVRLGRGIHHVNQVVKTPKQFGLTSPEIMDIVGVDSFGSLQSNIATWNVKLVKFLTKRHWARVVSDGVDPDIEVQNIKDLRIVLKYHVDKIRSGLDTVTYDIHDTGSSGIINSPKAIDLFLKTGRINKSRLAAFR